MLFVVKGVNAAPGGGASPSPFPSPGCVLSVLGDWGVVVRERSVREEASWNVLGEEEGGEVQ